MTKICIGLYVNAIVWLKKVFDVDIKSEFERKWSNQTIKPNECFIYAGILILLESNFDEDKTQKVMDILYHVLQNKGYIKELYERCFSTTPTSLPRLNTKTLKYLKKNHDDKMNIINDGTSRSLNEMLKQIEGYDTINSYELYNGC
ncbi:14527_t:CDS:2 [Gigaspora rosea]|nr:14527_t:CDS:2 [Gigaspora rosea]